MRKHARTFVTLAGIAGLLILLESCSGNVGVSTGVGIHRSSSGNWGHSISVGVHSHRRPLVGGVMMRILSIAVTLALALLLPALAPAETITYEHRDEALFSITFPGDWYVDTDVFDEARAAGLAAGDEPELRIIEAMPSDGTKLWFGIWVAPRTTTLNRGLEYVASLDGELFTDVVASEPRDVELGGMTAKTLFGTAKRQDEAVEYAVALFEPQSEVIAVALYVGRPQTWEKHQEQLSKIVDSLARAGS